MFLAWGRATSTREERKFSTAREGGGRKILDFTYFFQLTKIQCSNVSMGFGVFLNFKSKAGKNFSKNCKGGEKNLQRVLKGGGEKFSTRLEGGGGEKFSTSDFLESLGKIKGHVKTLFHK